MRPPRKEKGPPGRALAPRCHPPAGYPKKNGAGRWGCPLYSFWPIDTSSWYSAGWSRRKSWSGALNSAPPRRTGKSAGGGHCETPEDAETARDVYRFELKVPAGQTAKQTVTEERDVGSAVQLTNSPDEQVRVFLQSPVVSEKVKEGLKKAQGLRWEWGKTQREIAEQQRQLQAITEDQTRLRANLREVPQSSPLHKRYLDKLNRQEDEVEKYRAEVKKLQGQEHEQKKALDEFLAAFSAD